MNEETKKQLSQYNLSHRNINITFYEKIIKALEHLKK